jgi:hypothetical protein
MGAIIASGGAVPLSAIEGLTAAQADALAEHNIEDIDALAATSVDDLVEYLDLSLDEAEEILRAAQAVIAARDAKRQDGDESIDEATGEAVTEETEQGAPEGAEQAGAATGEGASVETAPEETVVAAGEAEPRVAESGEGESEMADREKDESAQQHAFSAELDPTARPGDINPPEEMIAEGYDEAVETGTPFTAEPNILAEDSADPVALTEADPMSTGELLLQDAGRDLRPDTITPSPDITSSGAAYIDAASHVGEGEPPVEEDAGSFSPEADFASEASAPEVQTSSAPAPEYREDVAAPVESDEEEKSMNSSEDNAAQ